MTIPTQLSRPIRTDLQIRNQKLIFEVFFNFLKANATDGQRNDVCLEFGSGRFGYINFWKKYFKKSFAPDIYDFHKEYEDVEFLLSKDQRSIPLNNNYVDLIVSHSVLEHVVDLESTIKEMDRVLKVGGYALLTVCPLYWSSSGGHLYTKDRVRLNEWEHLNPESKFYIEGIGEEISITLGGILFILIDVLVYVTGERTSFMYMLISSLFIILLINRFQYVRLITLFISLLLIVGITFVSPTVKKRMVDTTLKQVGFGSDQLIFFSPQHDSHIKTAFNMFLDKPILGHGPKMFRVKCSDPQYAVGISPCATHPHNFYVQLLAETGIIGFLFLLSLFGYVVYCAFRQLQSIVLKKKRYLTDYQVCLLAGILITVWPFSPNGNFFNNWLAIVYSLPVGFYLHSMYGKNR